jgi:hypothetical protein
MNKLTAVHKRIGRTSVSRQPVVVVRCTVSVVRKWDVACRHDGSEQYPTLLHDGDALIMAGYA